MANSSDKDMLSVLIPDGESQFALCVLQCLAMVKKMKVYILSNDKDARIRYSRYTTKFIGHRLDDGPENYLSEISHAVKKYDIDVLLPVSIPAIRFLSSHAYTISQLTSLSLLPTIENLEIAEDKWLLYEWLCNKSIPSPPTILYKKGLDLDEKLNSMCFPVLLKPRKGSGGEGIEFFKNKSDLLNFCEKNIQSKEFIIQSFINGYDIDCSILADKGKILAYTIQRGFMYSEKPVSWPSGIDFLFDENTFFIVRELISKLNWTGIVHIDLRYDEKDKQVKIIEMNPRFWASVAASTFAGVNFPYLSCLAALNRELPKVDFKSKRVLRAKPAMKLMVKRIINPKNKKFYFDNSFLEFFLKDPLPNLYSQFPKLFKIISKKMDI